MLFVNIVDIRMIWSRPIPLGWYFHNQWTRFMGSNYVEAMCDKFVEDDRMWKNFANELPTVSINARLSFNLIESLVSLIRT